MSGIVQIAPDKSAQLNSKQDQTLLSRRCFTPISDEKKKASAPLQPHCWSVWSGRPAPVVCLLGASFLRERGSLSSQTSVLFSASLKWVGGVSALAPPSHTLPSAPSRSQLLWNENAFFLQVVTRLLPASFPDACC